MGDGCNCEYKIRSPLPEYLGFGPKIIVISIDFGSALHFLMQEEICHWFQPDCIQVPQKKHCRLFCQGTTGKWDRCCKAPASLQPQYSANRQVQWCLFVSFKSGVQMMCVKICCIVNFVNFIQLLDLVRITEFSVVYTSKPMNAALNPVFKVLDLFQ